MKIYKKWNFYTGLLFCVLGSIALFTGSFEMSNYGVYLTGTQARLSGGVLVVYGAWWIFSSVREQKTGDK
jgi:putative Mn2+ efflux pump MntP